MDKNYENFKIVQDFTDENDTTYVQYHKNEHELFEKFTMGWNPLCSTYDLLKPSHKYFIFDILFLPYYFKSLLPIHLY